VFTRRQQPSKNLTKLRMNAGLSGRHLAEKANVSAQVVWSAEHGSVPRNSAQLRIAEALGVTPLELWPLVDDEEPVAA
jgi:transcriptional regulator with XRE-family HTH domain